MACCWYILDVTIENPISNAEGMAAPASGRQAQHTLMGRELVIGRALFQFIPSSEKNQILAGKMRNKATASSVYASGQVSAGNMPQKLATVNIYDVKGLLLPVKVYRHGELK